MTRYFHRPEARPEPEFLPLRHPHHGSGQNGSWPPDAIRHYADNPGIAAWSGDHSAIKHHHQQINNVALSARLSRASLQKHGGWPHLSALLWHRTDRWFLHLPPDRGGAACLRPAPLLPV